MTIKTDNLRIALIKTFADALADFMKDARADHLEQLLEKFNDEGTKSFAVTLPDGTKVGNITLPEGKPADQTFDEAALFEWAEEQGGIDVEVIPATKKREVKRVRPSWLAEKVKNAIEGDDGELTDVETGEIIPGIRRVPGKAPSSFTITYAKDGREKIAMAYRRGLLNDLAAGSALPQIEPARQEAAA
ncbi:MAG: hypothetical protein M3O29_00370 [Actinomycetota bacterium]|nr:hypothetical protein [Actinomycetota bacterium]